MASITVEEFSRATAQIRKEIGKRYRELQGDLVGEAIAFLADQPPVMTGAYRASHVVEDAEGGTIYKGPDWVPDGLIVPRLPLDRFEPVNGNEARKAVRAALPALAENRFQSLVVRNGRFYADGIPKSVEERYAVYAKLEAHMEAAVEKFAHTVGRITFGE